jgi:MFS family permease
LKLVPSRYAALFAHRGAARFVALSLIMRMPLGTVGLSVLLHVRELTSSIAFAGSVVGAQLLATAVAAPVAGRVADRSGPRGVLIVTGTLCPLALLLILFAEPLALPRAAIFAAAIAAGAFSPPITVIVRALWRHRVDDDALRHTAFALDAVLLELAYTLGPLTVALAVAVASPQFALALACSFVALAVPLMFASGALPWWKREPAGERHSLGPLRDRELLRVYASTFALTLAFGATEVAYQAFARAAGADAWGPTLIAINSIGSAVGGLAYGAMHPRMAIERQLPRASVLMALPLAAQALVPTPWAMAPWAFVAGVMIAPAMTAVSLIVAKNSPPRYATEAFTWSSTAIVTGVGTGTAVSGAIAERWGSTWSFAFTAACAIVSSALALRLRTTRS